MIEFLKSGMYYFREWIMSEELDPTKKFIIIELFTEIHKFLRIFATNNTEN